MNKKEKIKEDAIKTFKDDIRTINGVQYVPVSDAKAAVCFAVDNSERISHISNIANAVNDVMEAGKKFGLECEIIASAFIELKNNPSFSIGEALESGVNEWIK